MSCSRDGGLDVKIVVSGGTLGQVDNSCYLGVNITLMGTMEE